VPQQCSLGDFVPTKLYDCCALGRPLTVAAVGETARIAERASVGLAVDPDDPRELAAAVRRLRDDPALAARLSENGSRFAAENLRERQSDRVVTLAEELVARRPRSTSDGAK